MRIFPPRQTRCTSPAAELSTGELLETFGTPYAYLMTVPPDLVDVLRSDRQRAMVWCWHDRLGDVQGSDTYLGIAFVDTRCLRRPRYNQGVVCLPCQAQVRFSSLSLGLVPDQSEVARLCGIHSRVQCGDECMGDRLERRPRRGS